MAAGSAIGGVIIQDADIAAAFASAGALSLAGALLGAWGLPVHRHRRQPGRAAGIGCSLRG